MDDASFRQALKLKKNVYLAEGAFSGGDRATSNFKVSNIRVAANPGGFDRVVVDFQNSSRAPFFMVQNDPTTRRVTVTIYGKVKLDFSMRTASQSAKKSKWIQSLEFIPLVEEDRFIFYAQTQKPVKTEVFELTGPARIIIDLKP